jgi:hypothetical protein
METCTKCQGKIVDTIHYQTYPHYLQHDKVTSCMFYYPNVIIGTIYICSNGHKLTKEHLPDEESDLDYRKKYADRIRRQKEFMNTSYIETSRS